MFYVFFFQINELLANPKKIAPFFRQKPMSSSFTETASRLTLESMSSRRRGTSPQPLVTERSLRKTSGPKTPSNHQINTARQRQPSLNLAPVITTSHSKPPWVPPPQPPLASPSPSHPLNPILHTTTTTSKSPS